MSKTNKIHIRNIALAAGAFLVSFAIIALSPIKNLIPGYPNAIARQAQMEMQLKLDSLERSLYRWDLYTENLRRVIEGESSMQIDSLISKAEREYDEKKFESLSESHKEFNEMVEEHEKFEISDKNKRNLQIEGLHFFKPLNGTISHHYQAAQHPYIDITAPEGSTVKSILDGSVIYTEWTEADAWTIIIQHQDGIISIYKHNRSLLKNVADKVSAGTAIALLGGNTADAVKGTHLHFELWRGGVPIDPAEYINF